MMAASHLRVVDERELVAHEAANIFPLMTALEFDSLVADMSEHGQREPIVLIDGQILDGRNRYRACRQLGVEPIAREWDGAGTPEAFVVSHNLHRRHLTDMQRAVIAARLATAKSGERRDLSDISERSISVPEAAKLLNVGRDTVYNVKQVLASGTPEEIAAVSDGSVGAATIANQIRAKVPPQQREKTRNKPLADKGKNPERIQNQQLNAEIWDRIKTALTHLTSLPAASEVAALVRANSSRNNFTTQKLANAVAWLKEFDNAWSSNSGEA